MKPSFRRTFWLLLILGSPGFLTVRGAETDEVPSPSNRLATAKALQMPPMPPKSPVDSFRELLAMKPAEREKLLAARPPEVRKHFLAKIQEYEALTPEERELRLQATQLRWYLLPLMRTPPTNRVAQLAAIPEADRPLVTERLLQWDLLPPGLQKEFLAYGLTASYFVGQDADHPNVLPRTPLDKMLPPDLVQKMDYVRQMPPERRQAMYDGFEHFFKLTEADRRKTLATLSPEERQQMQKSLVAFMRLPKSQRDQCIRSFGQFASMTDEERRGFFQNAGRWEKMSPAERQAWRNLVNRFPPMPPMRPPPPPLPPSLQSAVGRPGVPVATNRSP